MTGYPEDPKQMQAAYSSQQNMMSGMIPQQSYGPVAQSQHQQQPQQRIPQHYPQSGHQMYPAPSQQAPASQPYPGYGVQHQSSRSSAAQHPGYSHTGLEQTGYGHLPNQGPVALPPLGLQQSQSHLGQAAQSHQQQLHQLQHPSMSPIAQPTVLGTSHGSQQQQSHLASQPQHVSTAMHHASSANQHSSSMISQQGNQPSHQISQTHNPSQMPLQMGHGMLPSYTNQMSAASSSAPPQLPSYLSNSKPIPATQQHNSSPQYRAPFPQLSPQMSPRPQMSPHPQMSPRPVMSPAKPPQHAQNVLQSSSSQPTLTHIPGISSPSARSQPSLPPIQANVKSSIASTSTVPNTLQALEQMVLPVSSSAAGMEYNQSNYRQQSLPSMPNNPLSPIGSRVTISPQQHQQWPTHRTQLNGNGHLGIMPQMQMQMQQQSSVQMMGISDLMSSPQPMQIISPSIQHQQSTYNSYEDLTQTSQPQQKSALDTIHKPYENLAPSLALQMGNNLINQQIMSPTLQSQQQIETQQVDQYGSLQTNQTPLPISESIDQSSDLNLLDSYSNTTTVNTSNLSTAAQKSSIDDSMLSQTTNENSQSSHTSDNVINIVQTNNFNSEITQDDNANQQTMEQDLPCLDSHEVNEDYQKVTEVESEQVSQDSQLDVLVKTSDLQYGYKDHPMKTKLADSTIIQDLIKKQTNETTNLVVDVLNVSCNIFIMFNVLFYFVSILG